MQDKSEIREPEGKSRHEPKEVTREEDSSVLSKPSDLTWQKREHVHGIRI